MEGIIPGPGYSSVLRVKYDLSVKLFTPTLIAIFLMVYVMLRSATVYPGI